MWWGWSDAVQLYLAQGVAIVQRGARRGGPGVGMGFTSGTQVVRFPLTWNLQRALAHVQEEALSALVPKTPKAARWVRAARRVPLDVALSAAWCPPVCFTVPAGVRHFEELRTLAVAQTAQTAQATPHTGGQAHAVKLDPLEPYLAARLNPHTAADITQWAAGAGLRLRSIRPLWSIATQSKAMGHMGLRALILQEPDGFTLLAHASMRAAPTSDPANHSWHAMVIPQTAPDELAWQQVQRWKTSLALAGDEVGSLAFQTQPTHALDSAPGFLRAHWSCP